MFEQLLCYSSTSLYYFTNLALSLFSQFCIALVISKGKQSIPSTTQTMLKYSFFPRTTITVGSYKGYIQKIYLHTRSMSNIVAYFTHFEPYLFYMKQTSQRLLGNSIMKQIHDFYLQPGVLFFQMNISENRHCPIHPLSPPCHTWKTVSRLPKDKHILLSQPCHTC